MVPTIALGNLPHLLHKGCPAEQSRLTLRSCILAGARTPLKGHGGPLPQSSQAFLELCCSLRPFIKQSFLSPLPYWDHTCSEFFLYLYSRFPLFYQEFHPVPLFTSNFILELACQKILTNPSGARNDSRKREIQAGFGRTSHSGSSGIRMHTEV